MACKIQKGKREKTHKILRDSNLNGTANETGKVFLELLRACKFISTARGIHGNEADVIRYNNHRARLFLQE